MSDAVHIERAGPIALVAIQTPPENAASRSRIRASRAGHVAPDSTVTSGSKRVVTDIEKRRQGADPEKEPRYAMA